MKTNLEKKNKNVLFPRVFYMLAFITPLYFLPKQNLWKNGIILECISVLTKLHSPILSGFVKVFQTVPPSIYLWPLLFYLLPWLLQSITSERKHIQMTIFYEPFCSDLLLTFPFVHKNTNKIESPPGILQRFVPFSTQYTGFSPTAFHLLFTFVFFSLFSPCWSEKYWKFIQIRNVFGIFCQLSVACLG